MNAKQFMIKMRERKAQRKNDEKMKEIDKKFKERMLDIDLQINEALKENNEEVMKENERLNDPAYSKRQVKHEYFKNKIRQKKELQWHFEGEPKLQ